MFRQREKTHRILSTLLNFLAVIICGLSRQPTSSKSLRTPTAAEKHSPVSSSSVP
jgi:hypothetical protein